MIATAVLALVMHPIPYSRWIARKRAAAIVQSRLTTVTGPQTIIVGHERLHRCDLVVPGYCGLLSVPLNWRNEKEGTIRIRFEWIPAREARSNATIVAQEGGPGYASTGTGDQYQALFAPLLGNHNLLMMDERGTGGSFPIDCQPLQTFAGSYFSAAFHDAVARCGAQLNHTFRIPHGGEYVHASDLFDTSQSIRDLAAILGALDQKPVDLYGDSYGSFFAQVFAAHYPHLLRSVVLDSTYPTLNQNPFDPPAQVQIRFAFDAVCRRSLACSAAAPGSSIARIDRLADRLHSAPLITKTTTPLGQAVILRAGAPDLETLLTAGAYDYGTYRNLDAATRAWLDHGDSAPLARLFEWTISGPAFTSYPYTEYSAGLANADGCTVYAQPFNMLSSISQRREQFERTIASLPPHFAYPVANQDALAAPDEVYDNCLTWPAPRHFDPIITKKRPLVPPTLPVMILSADLDSITSRGDAQQALQQLGPSARLVSIPNENHAPALADLYDCASRIVRVFVVAPNSAVDTSCAQHIPEIRTVGVFPARLADQPPAMPLAGNRANATELRLAAVATEAIGDAIYAMPYVQNGGPPNCGNDYCGVGLRGGSNRFSADSTRVTLDRSVYALGTSISASIHIRGNLPTGFVSGRDVHAILTGSTVSESLDISWDQRRPRELALIRGVTSSGNVLRASTPAP